MTKHDFRFTPEDHERMKATLESLPDYPTEAEAEAVLQACGTSGKEVVNEFIERLLKENLELKQELARRAAVAGPRGDVVDEALGMFKEVYDTVTFLGGETIHIAVGSELANKLIAAAPSSPTPAEQPSSLIADAIAKVREMEAENKRNYEYWKSIASDPTDMGVMKFLCWSGEDSRVIAMLESLAPPERIRVEGEQETK